MKELTIKLKVWRQKNSKDKGRFVDYDVPGLNEHMSFLEMLDVLNERLISLGEEPIAFDHDCREGICGSCSMVCLLYTSPSPRDLGKSRMPSSA